jgi:hypothetical protein
MRSIAFPLVHCLHTLLLLPIHLATCDNQNQHVLTPQSPLRNATRSDTASIATVVNAAFAPIDNWQYLYQFAKDHPAEHQRCAEREIGTVWNYDNIHMQVIEAPADSNLTVAAVAVWEWIVSENNEMVSRFMRRSESAVDFDRGLDVLIQKR